jgi:hypothetical protein
MLLNRQETNLRLVRGIEVQPAHGQGLIAVIKQHQVEAVVIGGIPFAPGGAAPG